MTEAPSATTFVLAAALPWAEDTAVPDAQGAFDRAAVHLRGARAACSIRKISALGATLRGDLKATPGEAVAVELESGQRPSAKVAWTKGDETGVGFDRPIDVLALVNRKLVSQPGERRAMPRVELRCGAWIKKGQDFLPATVRNISSGGLQLEGDSLPEVGSYVNLFVEGLSVPPGEVVWRREKLAGIELMGELSWASIMPWIRELLRKQPQ